MNKNSNQIILSEDTRRIELQKEFNADLVVKFKELLDAYDTIGLSAKLTASDFAGLNNGHPEPIIERMIGIHLQDVELGGFKINPAKAVAMMDIKKDDFIDKFNEIKRWINESHMDARSKQIALTFDVRFFNFTDGVIEDKKYFDQWVESQCKVYTKNETQVKLYQTLSDVCKGFNELIGITRLRTDPNDIIGEELAELISFSQGKFVVNTRFVTSR
jgi:hypothetical protein